MAKNLSKNLSVLGLATLCAAGCAIKPNSPGLSSTKSVSIPESAMESSAITITKLRPYRETTLPNGLRVLFLPESSLPALSMSLVVRSGSASDPSGMAGLMNLVSELLDQGSKKRDANKIADDLAKIGASFESSVSYDYAYLSISGLSISSQEILNNFYEIATQPSFSDKDFTRTKKQILARIERGLDNPRVVADMAATELLFGAHPYGRPVSGRFQDVSGLTKKSVIQHYLRFYRPNNSILAVVGKFDEAFEKRVEAEFGAWSNRDIPKSPLEAPAQRSGIRVRVVEKAGLTQAQIRIAGLGIKRQDDDFLKLRIANTVLGGAFASRLNEKIRKEMGLTYNINSSFDSRLERGPFEIETFTKVESIEKVVSETLKLYGEFINKGITEEELNRTRGFLRGIFPQAIETSEKLAFNLMLLRLYGISDRYLTHYIRDLNEFSVSDINGAIRRNMKMDGLSIVVHAPKGSSDGLKKLTTAFDTISVDSLK